MRVRRCQACVEVWPQLRPHSTEQCPLNGATMVRGKRVFHGVEENVPRKKLRSRGSRSPERPKRKFDLDLDLLECPICFEYFSPPVYQCENGHLICSKCSKKVRRGCPSCEEPIDMRAIVVDKIIESLSVDCKYARYGCPAMLKCGVHRANHEKYCDFAPNFPCPTPGCTFDGTKFTLPGHLKEKHEVPTVELNVVSRRVAFRMDMHDRLVIVKGIGDAMYLLHRELREGLIGEIFFVTSFGIDHMDYDLKVRLKHGCAKKYSLTDCVTDVRMMDDCREGDFLLYSFSEGDVTHGYDIDLGISRRSTDEAESSGAQDNAE